MNKKRQSIFLAVVTAVTVFFPVFSAQSADELSPAVASSHGRTLFIGIDKNPPISIPVSEEKAIGFYPEILEEIAKREGWRLKYIPCSGRSCCKMLDVGDVDLVIGSPWSKKRTKLYDFSATGIVKNWGNIIGRQEQYATLRNTASLQDLAGKTIGGVRDDTVYEKLKDQLFEEGVNNVKFLDFPDNSQVILAVAGKVIDFGILTRFYASRAKKYGVILVIVA